MAKRRYRRRDYLPATQLASLAYCETKTVLAVTKGDRATPEQVRQRAEGTSLHAAFDKKAVAHHNAKPAVDRRCFVATAVYGEADHRTEALRHWRDRVLMPSPAGRWLVRVYYRASPGLATCVGRHAWLAGLVRWVLDGWVKRIRHDGEG